MKVLHVLDHSLPEVDGYSIRSQNILLQQREAGDVVVAVTSPKHGKFEALLEEIEGIRFYRTPYEVSKSGFGALPYVKEVLLIRHLYQRILEIARQEKIQIVHAHSPSLNGIAAYLAGCWLNLPVVYEMRTLWEEAPAYQDQTVFGLLRLKVSRWLETLLLRRVRAITVISRGLKQEIVGRGISANKVTVFPNGVDLKRFTPRPTDESLKRELGLDGQIIIGFIGSFFFWEGLDLLVKAVATVVKDRPDIHLILVGRDKDDRLRDLVKGLTLEEFVTLTGPVAPDRILNYYSIIDLLIYPRISMPLTELVTPLKPLEAMAMAKLVLASDVGGHKELIRDNETGLLFRADNVTDLVAKISQIATNIDRFEVVRQEGRRDVLQTRNWMDVGMGYSDLYRRVLADSHNR